MREDRRILWHPAPYTPFIVRNLDEENRQRLRRAVMKLDKEQSTGNLIYLKHRWKRRRLEESSGD